MKKDRDLIATGGGNNGINPGALMQMIASKGGNFDVEETVVKPSYKLSGTYWGLTVQITGKAITRRISFKVDKEE